MFNFLFKQSMKGFQITMLQTTYAILAHLINLVRVQFKRNQEMIRVLLIKKKKHKQREQSKKFLHQRKKCIQTDKSKIFLFFSCDNFMFQEMFNTGILFGIARLKIVGNYDSITECCC